jgi:PAS domain S-box-containing protein
MDLHPGTEKRRVAETLPAKSDSLRRALQENEDWYQDLVEHSRDLLCIHDLEGRLLSVNPAPARVLGYSVEELLRVPMRELLTPEYRPHFDAYLREIERDGESQGVMAVLTRSGEHRIWEYHNTLRTEGVELPIVLGIAHDVTEQRRTEKRLREVSENLLDKVRESERTIRELKLFRTLVDQSNDSIKVIDPETLRILDVNEKTCTQLGYSREELLSLGVFDIDPTATQSSTVKVKKELEKSGFLVMESIHRRKDGSTFPVEVSMRRVQLDIDYVVTISRDITERKQGEEALKNSEEKFSKAFRQSPMALTLSSTKNDQYIDVNKTFERLTGWRRDEVIGRTALEIGLWTPADGVHLAKQLLAEGSVPNVEARYRVRDGSIRIGLSTAEAIELNGEPCMLAVTADITERKQTEERLREYESVVESLEEVILVVDRDYRYVIANREFLKRRGLKREQVLGRTVMDRLGSEGMSKEALALVKEKMDECFQGKIVEYELIYQYPTLGPRNLFLSYFPIEGPTGIDRIACVLRDVTESKQAEEALRRSEENYRNFVSQSSDGIYQDDLDPAIPIDLPEEELIHRFLRSTVMVECNNAMAAMYGFASGEELRGRRMSERVLPEDPHNIEMAREFIRSGFRLLEHESHEVDRYGKPKICMNSMVGTVEDGRLVRIWGIQRDITEKVKLEESRRRAEESLLENVAQLREVTEELRLAKEKLSEEKLYLEQAIDTELGFGEIIGRSSALKEVMRKVAKVAPSDATVLLLGETGTGKELVARAIHRLSQREGNSFIKLNCAAIPSGLLESELFGHERGAFTGAVARKLGRLELADRGTLFLDEVGEIPLGLQPKLLRVLQDLEFERLGGTQTLKVNFRLLAATNRDLLQSVKEREFRSDLYYRLNVFPIVIPPLRERREDIRPLIEHFVRKFAAQMKKSITGIPSKTMEMMVRWDWPGNIRELENFVERSVILTPGSVLQAPLAELQTAVEHGNLGAGGSLRDKDRERILRALRDCRGKLGGPDGAAARLGLKRTTLQSKLDHLGIKPGSYRA